MSLSLLKRSIAIVEEELPTTKKKKQNSASTKQAKSTRSLLELIPEKQRLFGKYRNNRGNQVQYEKLQHTEKITIDDLREQSKNKTSKAEENLKKLLRMSSKKVNQAITDKLLNNVKRRQRLAEDEDSKPKEESIFTEEDFQKFEKEYFASM